MNSKKKLKKQEKPTQQKVLRFDLQRLPLRERLEHLEKLIDQGNPREAIQELQQLQSADSPEYDYLLMRGYAARARQLQEKGLDKEASILMDMLSPMLAKADRYNEREMSRVLSEMPMPFALHAYVKQKSFHDSCPEMERVLADHLVFSNAWASLDALPDEDVLKKDGMVMANAVPDLDAARWQEGLTKLDSLSRKSPFAPWKLFAKAMASADQGDEASLQRALKQLPDSFPLRKTVGLLQEKGVEGLGILRECQAKPFNGMAHEIVKAIQTKSKQIPALLTQFAQALFPENPGLALRSLSEAAAIALIKRQVKPVHLEKYIPPDFLKPILARLPMFASADVDLESGSAHFCLARDYFKHFDLEASYIGERPKAEAALYFYLLSNALLSRVSPTSLPPEERSCLLQWLGSKDIKASDLFVAVLDKITRLAPEVDLYPKLARQIEPSQISQQGKELLEQMLLRVREHFPEDPSSYIYLSRLYLSKGAYRKSQKILEEAWNQAPYDPQVRESFGLGLLKAVIMSRKKKGGAALARRDLTEAMNLNVKNLLPLTHALKASLDYLEGNAKESAMAALNELASLGDAVVRFRSLICFYQDLVHSNDAGASVFAQTVRQRAVSDLKKALNQTVDTDLAQIIAPLPREFTYLIGKFDALRFFDRLWTQILGKLNDQHVLGVYTQLLADNGDEAQAKWVKKDVKARLKRRSDNLYFRLFAALAEYQIRPEEGSSPFYTLVAFLSEDDRKKLKEFCRTIAPSFEEPLSHALGAFNFQILDDDDDWFDPDFDDDDDDDWDDHPSLWEDDDMAGSGEEAFEMLVQGLRQAGSNTMLLRMMFDMLISEISRLGFGDAILRDMGRVLESSAGDIIQNLRKIYSGKGAKGLNRAGRLLLFPDQR